MSNPPIPSLLNIADYALVLSDGTYTQSLLDSLGDFAFDEDGWNASMAEAVSLADAMSSDWNVLDAALTPFPAPAASVNTTVAAGIAASLDASAESDGAIVQQFDPTAPLAPTPPADPTQPAPGGGGGVDQSPPSSGGSGSGSGCEPYLTDDGQLICNPYSPPVPEPVEPVS